jgi:predicted transposase/invertase (TIGR01784 family)
VKDAPTAVPALKGAKGDKQLYMDVHVVSSQGTHYIIEMQSKRHIMFDERILFYACGTFAQQLTEKELSDKNWYTNLKTVIALNVVDYNSNLVRGLTLPGTVDNMLERVRDHPLKDGDFIKHYKLTDKASGQEIDHLQLVQVELPRAVKDNPLFPPKEDFDLQDWWVSVLKYTNQYNSEMVEEWYKKGAMPEVIYMAMRRLYLPDWNPRDRDAYQVELVDIDAFALTLEVSKASGIKEGIKEEKERVAHALKGSGVSVEAIAQCTGLSVDAISLL